MTSTTEVPRRAAATGVRGEPVEGSLEPGGADGRIPGRVERPDRVPVGTDRRDEPVEVDDDRPCQAHGPWPARRSTEEGRPAAELDPQVHDDALALRVDRRVRDLGERLAQVVGDGPVEPGAAGRRRVVAHAPERLVGLERHRLDVEAGAFGVEAGEIAQDVVGGVVSAARRALEAVLVHRPRGVVDREGAERAGLRLGVLEDGAAARLDQQQLARPEAATPDRLGGGERHGARLGRDGDEPVARDREGGGSQPVAVDQRAHGPAVGEDDGGGTVPWREEPGRPARSVATCGCGARRSASASGIAVRSAAVRSQPVAVRSSSASSSDSESEPSSDSSGPAARSSRAISDEAASAARPRTCSRLPRTVLISPLCEIERNGWASRHTGRVFVA